MFFTKWLSTGDTTILCCFTNHSDGQAIGGNDARRYREQLYSGVKEVFRLDYGQRNHQDPYWPHLLILKAVIKSWDRAVWALDKLVIDAEQAQSLLNDPPNLDYKKLHNTLRYAIHHAENLGVAINTVQKMKGHYDELYPMIVQTDRDSQHAIIQKYCDRQNAIQKTRRWLDFQHQVFCCLHTRALAFEKRMQNQIDLVSRLH